MTTATTALRVGALLRDWRQRRRRSQLDLALDAGISARHLSFIETGRSLPSRRMILRLAAELDVPYRDRNRLLLAAGYAPLYPQRSLDDQQMAPVRAAIDLVLTGHEPYPAVVLDAHWNLVTANAPVAVLLEGVGAELLEPPANVLRVSLHPDGMAAPATAVGELRIDADPQTVFSVISAIDQWPSWNPNVKSVTLQGPVQQGTVFRWKSGSSTLTSTLQVLDPPHEIAWTGMTMGIKAVHLFRFQANDGGTLARSEESWEGLLASLLKGYSRKTLDKEIGSVLSHLKAEAERRAAAA